MKYLFIVLLMIMMQIAHAQNTHQQSIPEALKDTPEITEYCDEIIEKYTNKIEKYETKVQNTVDRIKISNKVADRRKLLLYKTKLLWYRVQITDEKEYCGIENQENITDEDSE